MLSRRIVLVVLLTGTVAALLPSTSWSAGKGSGNGSGNGSGKGTGGGPGGGNGKGTGAANGKGEGKGAGQGKAKAKGTISSPKATAPGNAKLAAPTTASVRIRHKNGFQEILSSGRYHLKDNRGRTIIERPATRKDLDRVLHLNGG